MQTRRGLQLSDELACPVCRASVAASSSMCFSCHLPIRDVAANQSSRRGSWASKGRRLGRRIIGLLAYAASVLWCWVQLPTAMLFVVPGAVAGAWFHAGKGRPGLGLIAFLVVVAVLPLLFWPSMLTGLFSDLTAQR